MKKKKIEIQKVEHHLSNCNVTVNAQELPEEIEVLKNLSEALNNLTKLVLIKEQNKKTRPIIGVLMGEFNEKEIN